MSSKEARRVEAIGIADALVVHAKNRVEAATRELHAAMRGLVLAEAQAAKVGSVTQ